MRELSRLSDDEASELAASEKFKGRNTADHERTHECDVELDVEDKCAGRKRPKVWATPTSSNPGQKSLPFASSQGPCYDVTL